MLLALYHIFKEVVLKLLCLETVFVSYARYIIDVKTAYILPSPVSFLFFVGFNWVVGGGGDFELLICTFPCCHITNSILSHFNLVHYSQKMMNYQ